MLDKIWDFIRYGGLRVTRTRWHSNPKYFEGKIGTWRELCWNSLPREERYLGFKLEDIEYDCIVIPGFGCWFFHFYLIDLTKWCP